MSTTSGVRIPATFEGVSPTARPVGARGIRLVLARGAPWVAFLLLALPAPLRAACTPGNILLDGGFEGGFVNTYWTTQTSTNFGTPLCDASCGGVGPRTGAYWAWFGGISAAETAKAGQTVTFPAAGATSVTLRFYLWISSVNAPFTDTLAVKVDGVTRMIFPEPAVAEAGYSLRSLDLTMFADGAAHAILFEYNNPTSTLSNFHMDDVSLDVVCSAPPVFQHGASRHVHGSAVIDLPL